MNVNKLRKFIIVSLFNKFERFDSDNSIEGKFSKTELDRLDCPEMFIEWSNNKASGPYGIYLWPHNDQIIFLGRIIGGSYVIKYKLNGERI